MTKPDSLIFDMDGTLWDNLDSYVIVWNRALEQLGHEGRVSRASMIDLMGQEARAMLDVILPGKSHEVQDELFDEVLRQYEDYSPHIQPIIYEGVLEGLEKLKEKYQLFLLSNCEEGGLVKFMNHTKTTHLITDYMEHGMNLQPKEHNLQVLKERHNLQSPVYVGDTEGDRRATHKAGMPFVLMSYGFGNTDKYDLKFDTFVELTDYYMNL